ncbi:MAG TPA: 30S ribosomal protein S6--L-glutamate ligase [Hyphomonas sp.]|nr:30S ribosomal protein S6--L-glutamate ligase [Hyphomonas sp.]
MPKHAPFELGWEEWLSLPDLGLPAIKAKVDTGAKTSALHASAIEPFGPSDNPQVRFLIQPDPNNPALEVTCSAPVVDRREVTSSNGETELRYVIETLVEMGPRRWTIQLTLTNRENMTYRMLFGRGAIQPDMVVDANESFRMPELSYRLYAGLPKRKPVRRPLRIALLTREPNNYSSQRLIEAAKARGHVIEAIDTARCYMRIGTVDPEVHYDGAALPRYDAVIPRIGAKITDYGMAVLRQFSNTGAFCLNGAGSIGRSRDKLLAHQLLARARIAMPVTAFAHSPKDTKDLISLVEGTPVVLKLLTSTQGKGVVLAETRKAAESLVDAFRGLDANFLVQEFVQEAAGTDVRAFVIGNRVVGAMKRQAQKGEFRSNLHRGGTASKIRLTAEERDTAREAVKVLGLNVAGVDLLQTKEGPKVLEVNSSPGLEGIEKATEKDIAGLVIEHVERQVRPLSRDREGTGRTARRVSAS